MVLALPPGVTLAVEAGLGVDTTASAVTGIRITRRHRSIAQVACESGVTDAYLGVVD